MKGQRVSIIPIGVVHSSIGPKDEMLIEGVSAVVEVYSEYADGLKGLGTNSHVIVVGWFHEAGREKLHLSRHGREVRGVFGLRSPDRPNPIGLSIARIVKLEERSLQLDRLDFFDGTPIIDLKRYSPGWDSVFSARSGRDLEYRGDRDAGRVLRDLLVEAVNFHGEACAGVALGVRMVQHACDTWKVGKKDPGIVVRWGADGCINDALQALTGATSGNGRLEADGDSSYAIYYRGESITFIPAQGLPTTVGAVLDAPMNLLFEGIANLKGDADR